ncbi:MAG: HemK2/MTQ2 family protein methyltransferase [Candidatus Nanohalobium sp.]
MAVYPVSEDTLLLKNCLKERELEDVKFLEMGTGNAENAVKAAEKGAEVTAVDINQEAVEYAEKKFEEEGLEAEVFRSNLFEQVKDTFDLIVFNPPYLPGEKGLGLEKHWRGGEKGVELSERFLEEVDSYLNDQGEVLLVLSSLADVEKLKEGFELRAVAEKELWFESLEVVRYSKTIE